MGQFKKEANWLYMNDTSYLITVGITASNIGYRLKWFYTCSQTLTSSPGNMTM
jgi:hypothetical protein